MSVPKIGVCEWGLPVQGPFSVRLAAEMGFSGMQMADCGGPGMQYPLNNPRIQQAYLELAGEYGVELHSVHLRSMFQDKTLGAAPGTQADALARECFSKTISACREMGIAVVMIAAMFKPYSDDAFRHFKAHLGYALRLGEENGVSIALETNLDNERLFRLREEYGANLRLCFDTCNSYIYDLGDPQPMLRDTLKRAPGFIEHYHVKDTRKEEFLIGRPSPILMGTGDSGIRETADIILANGFDGWIHSESYYFAPPINQGGDFYQIAKDDCKAIKQIFKLD